MEKILIIITIFCIFMGCSTFSNKAKEEELTAKVQKLELENKQIKQQLEDRETELSAKNQKLNSVSELTEKMLQRLGKIQDNYKKLVQENMDLYQKLYTERMDEQKKMLDDRTKALQHLGKDMDVLSQDNLKKDAYETKLEPNEWGKKNQDKLDNTDTSLDTKLENLDEKLEKLEKKEDVKVKPDMSEKKSLAKEKAKQALAEKRQKLVENGGWGIEDERVYIGIIQRMKNPLSPEEENKLLEDAFEFDTELSKRTK